MFRKMKKGFTMVELLVVLVIVAILAAVAAPIYMANVKRSIASDAVGIMSVIRQAERENKVKKGSYTEITDDSIYNLSDALGIDKEATQYFAHPAFRVDNSTPAWNGNNAITGLTSPQDFIITATGLIGGASATVGGNVQCTTDGETDCAHKTSNGDLATMRLEMDNSGRVFVSYDGGTTWEQY
jgi:prepilin-type N-terminal cleavage/methylation domain-containing protein